MPYSSPVTDEQLELMKSIRTHSDSIRIDYTEMMVKLKAASEAQQRAIKLTDDAAAHRANILVEEKEMLEDRQELFDSLKESMTPQVQEPDPNQNVLELGRAV